MTRDEVFVPATRSEKVKNGGKGTGKKVLIGGQEWDELLEDAPLYRLYGIIVQQVRLLSFSLGSIRSVLES